MSKANDLHECGQLNVTEAAVVNDEIEEELEPDGVEEDVFGDDNEKEEKEEDAPHPPPDSAGETMGPDASAPMATPAVSPVVALIEP